MDIGGCRVWPCPLRARVATSSNFFSSELHVPLPFSVYFLLSRRISVRGHKSNR